MDKNLVNEGLKFLVKWIAYTLLFIAFISLAGFAYYMLLIIK